MSRTLTHRLAALVLAGAVLVPGLASAQMLSVTATDQDVSSGTVTAASVDTTADGWLVVHRVAEGGKPGPVVGHAPLKSGKNENVAVTLAEPVKAGEMLMLMIHGEEGGMKAGEFEYTLGAKEDGPIRTDGKYTATNVTAK